MHTRLNGYLTARKTQLTELATKYGRGLDSRLNQAADAGDLKLTAAFDEKKARVSALVSSLATPVIDPCASVSQVPALPELPEGSPGTLMTLRQTWTGESDKILTTLDAALQQSLQALEVELTKARDLEKAKAVLAYRESFDDGSVGILGRTVADAATTPPAPGDLARATNDAPFENSLGMKFVHVPGTEAFFCIHETRYRDYEEYAKNAKENVDGSWKIQINDGYEIKQDAGDHPVTKVNWDDAQAFCKWLSEKEGKTYRLPTDREWSLAVGIGDQEDWQADSTPATVFQLPGHFPWGREWPPPTGAGNYNDESRRTKAPRENTEYHLDGYDDGFPTTSPVMSFEPNQLGLWDMGGNVWEWCEDWYPVKPATRVLRGGSWTTSVPEYVLTSHRTSNFPSNRQNYDADNYGFRVVLETPGSPSVRVAPSVSPPPPTAPDPALARATNDAPFENSLGMKFVPVPETEVRFCIHETRYRDYEEYARKAKESVEGSWKNQTYDGFEIKGDEKEHPVTRVGWNDAQAFCKWLSEKEGKTYRLPTDGEWSLAVGIGREFPWGDAWPPPQGAGNYSDESRRARAPRDDAKYLDGYDDGHPTTAPVMSFEKNPLGLFDLGGNVWEWCEDWFSNEQKERVLRGAPWNHYEPDYLLSSFRNRNTPDSRDYYYGFRVVVVVPSVSGQ